MCATAATCGHKTTTSSPPQTPISCHIFPPITTLFVQRNVVDASPTRAEASNVIANMFFSTKAPEGTSFRACASSTNEHRAHRRIDRTSTVAHKHSHLHNVKRAPTGCRHISTTHFTECSLNRSVARSLARSCARQTSNDHASECAVCQAHARDLTFQYLFDTMSSHYCGHTHRHTTHTRVSK